MAIYRQQVELVVRWKRSSPRGWITLSIGNRTVYTIAVSSRTVWGGKARGRHQAVCIWSTWPRYSSRCMSIEDAYKFFRELGVQDTQLFEEACRNKGWFIPSEVVLGDEEL